MNEQASRQRNKISSSFLSSFLEYLSDGEKNEIFWNLTLMTYVSLISISQNQYLWDKEKSQSDNNIPDWQKICQLIFHGSSLMFFFLENSNWKDYFTAGTK